jgi:molybdate transport system regulatory protein
LSIRIDLEGQGRSGPGKIQLLENIHSFGSISAAGRATGMSYMRAWVMLDQLNRTCGCRTVEPQIGGKNGGGATLTPFGFMLVARYRMIEQAVDSATHEELLALRADIGSPSELGEPECTEPLAIAKGWFSPNSGPRA